MFIISVDYENDKLPKTAHLDIDEVTHQAASLIKRMTFGSDILSFSVTKANLFKELEVLGGSDHE